MLLEKNTRIAYNALQTQRQTDIVRDHKIYRTCCAFLYQIRYNLHSKNNHCLTIGLRLYQEYSRKIGPQKKIKLFVISAQ